MPGEIGSRTEQGQYVRPDPGRIKVMRHIGSRTDKSDASHRIPDGQGDTIPSSNRILYARISVTEPEGANR